MRAREILTRRTDEGAIGDKIKGAYNNVKDYATQSALGRSGVFGVGNQIAAIHKQDSERNLAARKQIFMNELNSEIAHGIKTGTIVNPSTAVATTAQAPAQRPAPEVPQPTAQDYKPMSHAEKADNDRMASGANESRKYRIFDNLIEALIEQAAPAAQPAQTNQETISQYIVDYVNRVTSNRMAGTQYEAMIAPFAREAEQSYVRYKRVDPQILDKIWNVMVAWYNKYSKQSIQGQVNQKSQTGQKEQTPEAKKRLDQAKQQLKTLSNSGWVNTLNDPTTKAALKKNFEYIIKAIDPTVNIGLDRYRKIEPDQASDSLTKAFTLANVNDEEFEKNKKKIVDILLDIYHGTFLQ